MSRPFIELSNPRAADKSADNATVGKICDAVCVAIETVTAPN